MWIPELKCFEKLDARKWGENKLLNTDVKKLGKIDKAVNEGNPEDQEIWILDVWEFWKKDNNMNEWTSHLKVKEFWNNCFVKNLIYISDLKIRLFKKNKYSI